MWSKYKARHFGGQRLFFVWYPVLFALIGGLYGCGFHLRGTEATALPAELAVMRVIVERQPQLSNPLLQALRWSLETQAKVKIVAADSDIPVPTLILYNEAFKRQVFAVDAADASTSTYLLRYRVSFRLQDHVGGTLLEPQTIRLQRDYSFDPLNVLAKEREESILQQEMRRDAAQQIVRRLARVRFQQT